MRCPSYRRPIQVVLVGEGATALGTGLSAIARGTRAITGGAPAAPSIDSVLRFYVAWWPRVDQ